MNQLFLEYNLIIEGRKVSDSAMFYYVNVVMLETMTHEQFCNEFPETSKILELITKKQERFEKMMSEVK